MTMFDYTVELAEILKQNDVVCDMIIKSQVVGKLTCDLLRHTLYLIFGYRKSGTWAG